MRETGWRSIDEVVAELNKPLDAETVGFLVAESDNAIVLALNHQAIDGHLEMVGETITIPLEAVTSRKDL